MHGDRKRTVQILLNLMSNAVKFTATGNITVAATTSTTDLRVEVVDTGIGIKSAHLGMLFEAFRQVDGSAKRVYEGTGLGLYLCRKLLSIMGGEISVESEYGKGSRFMFSLPLALGHSVCE
jgi:signal transduction histidine kinase